MQSSQTRLEKSLTRILDQIDQMKEQLSKTNDSVDKAVLQSKLRHLGILRAYYVQLILIKFGDT